MNVRLVSRLRVVLIIFGIAANAVGDEVRTTTGDRYQGSIITFTNGTLVLRNDVLGILKIPKSKIASFSFGDAVPEPAPAGVSKPPATNAPALPADKETQKALAQLQAHTNLIAGVQSKFLASAGTEANDKFTQMVNDLLSGKLSVADIRAEAASVTSQLRAARKEIGEESNLAIDAYLAILERFLANSAPAAGGGDSK